jgi:hypothetical protein
MGYIRLIIFGIGITFNSGLEFNKSTAIKNQNYYNIFMSSKLKYYSDVSNY